MLREHPLLPGVVGSRYGLVPTPLMLHLSPAACDVLCADRCGDPDGESRQDVHAEGQSRAEGCQWLGGTLRGKVFSMAMSGNERDVFDTHTCFLKAR